MQTSISRWTLVLVAAVAVTALSLTGCKSGPSLASLPKLPSMDVWSWGKKKPAESELSKNGYPPPPSREALAAKSGRDSAAPAWDDRPRTVADSRGLSIPKSAPKYRQTPFSDDYRAARRDPPRFSSDRSTGMGDAAGHRGYDRTVPDTTVAPQKGFYDASTYAARQSKQSPSGGDYFGGRSGPIRPEERVARNDDSRGTGRFSAAPRDDRFDRSGIAGGPSDRWPARSDADLQRATYTDPGAESPASEPIRSTDENKSHYERRETSQWGGPSASSVNYERKVPPLERTSRNDPHFRPGSTGDFNPTSSTRSQTPSVASRQIDFNAPDSRSPIDQGSLNAPSSGGSFYNKTAPARY